MAMRLHMVVEGQTEERFVKRVLAPELAAYDVFVDARSVMTSRDGPRWYRGGLLDYARPRADLLNWMKQERAAKDVRFSTMFDLYALPPEFPGYAQAQRHSDPYAKVAALERAFGADIPDTRFIPHIQLHEFEALLFAAPVCLAGQFMEQERAIQPLIDLSVRANPEEIDDGAETAPSKRIIAAIPEYEGRKAFAGPIVAESIGLATLCARCRHFGEWVARLRTLAQ
jgi:hypothetical protein